jgi:hypothetical protein
MNRLFSSPGRVLSGLRRFWFAPTDPTTLGAVRIATGAVLLYTYAAIAPNALDYIGPNAWIDPIALETIRGLEEPSNYSYAWSVFSLVADPQSITALYWVFLGGIVAFMFGLFTPVATPLVWIGHVSFVHRAHLTWCGMDVILAMLTFYMMFAPCGAALSINRLWRRSAGPPRPSWRANLCIRLIQVHMAIVYLFAGLGKLQGSQWWDGSAVWSVMAATEFSPFDVTGLGRFGDMACLAISTLGVLITLGFEIGFIFLIWNRAARPTMLALAVLLHVGIGLFMGLGAFGAAMLTGCLAFVEPASLKAFQQFFRIPARRRQPLRTVETERPPEAPLPKRTPVAVYVDPKKQELRSELAADLAAWSRDSDQELETADGDSQRAA